MMKKYPLLTALLLSAILLSGCSVENDGQIQQKEKIQTESSNIPEYITNYKFVGNDANGYLQVPEDFELFTTSLNLNDDYFTYASLDRSFIVTFQLYSNAANIEAGTEKIIKMLQQSNIEANVTPVVINGMVGNEIHHYDEQREFNYSTFLLQGEHELRLITLEYYGEQQIIKDNIIQTYMELPYLTASPTLTLSETERAKEDALDIVSVVSFTDNSFTASVMSNDFDIIEISSNELTFRVRGTLDEGTDYFIALEEVNNFNYYGNFEGTVLTDDEGPYIEGTIFTEVGFAEDTLYHLTISNMTSIEEPQPLYMYFNID